MTPEVRENTLHQPIIREVPHSTQIIVRCSVCNKKLCDFYNCTDDTSADAVDTFLPNYCPNCGARLREYVPVQA